MSWQEAYFPHFPDLAASKSISIDIQGLTGGFRLKTLRRKFTITDTVATVRQAIRDEIDPGLKETHILHFNGKAHSEGSSLGSCGMESGPYTMLLVVQTRGYSRRYIEIDIQGLAGGRRKTLRRKFTSEDRVATVRKAIKDEIEPELSDTRPLHHLGEARSEDATLGNCGMEHGSYTMTLMVQKRSDEFLEEPKKRITAVRKLTSAMASMSVTTVASKPKAPNLLDMEPNEKLAAAKILAKMSGGVVPLLSPVIQQFLNDGSDDDDEDEKKDSDDGGHGDSDSEELMDLKLTVAMDMEIDTFDSEAFLRECANSWGVERRHIAVSEVRSGSVIVDMEIKNQTSAKLKVIARNAADVAKGEKLAKCFHVFLIEISEPPTIHSRLKKRGAAQKKPDSKKIEVLPKKVELLPKKVELSKAITLNLDFTRFYGKSHTYWSGVLKDGRDRGGVAYYCPLGWKRFPFKVTSDGSPADKLFKGHAIAYHGTGFKLGLSILLTGLLGSGYKTDAGLYLTPSILYAAHPRYAKVSELSADVRKEFGGGKFAQFVFECRVKPANIKKTQGETLLKSSHKTTTRIDTNFENNESLEFLVCDGSSDDYFPMGVPTKSAKVVISGLMVRVTDNHPILLPNSDWWFHSNYISEIQRQYKDAKNSGEKAEYVTF